MILHYLGRYNPKGKRSQRYNGIRIGLTWFALIVGDSPDSRNMHCRLLEAKPKQGNQHPPTTTATSRKEGIQLIP